MPTPFWVFDALHTALVRGRQTGGVYSISEVKSFPQTGPPPHIHLREDEDFYVLEGEFSFLLGGETIRAVAGDFVHVPKGTVHTYRNVGTAPARHLVVLTPGGFEEFFDAIARPAPDPDTPPAVDPALIAEAMELAPRYHLRFV